MAFRTIPTNRVLAALDPADRAILAPKLATGPMNAGDVLFDAGNPITAVYFPIVGQVSLLVVSEDGNEVESASVGNEGVVGLGGLLSNDVSFSQQRVQIAGTAYSIGRSHFLEAVNASSSLRRVLATYHDAFAAQMLQSVFCQAKHRSHQRIARWLLNAFDSVADADLALTQDAVAGALGVRRATVTIALRWMVSGGLIEVGRGRISLLNRGGLELQACPCYAIIKSGYDSHTSSV